MVAVLGYWVSGNSAVRTFDLCLYMMRRVPALCFQDRVVFVEAARPCLKYGWFRGDTSVVTAKHCVRRKVELKEFSDYNSGSIPRNDMYTPILIREPTEKTSKSSMYVMQAHPRAYKLLQIYMATTKLKVSKEFRKALIVVTGHGRSGSPVRALAAPSRARMLSRSPLIVRAFPH